MADSIVGTKEHKGKISYQEIDWDFITAIAKRVNRNKDKYGFNNWKNSMDLGLIQDAMLRHLISVINPDPEDPESVQDHLAAIGFNAQILYYHDKKTKDQMLPAY